MVAGTMKRHHVSEAELGCEPLQFCAHYAVTNDIDSDFDLIPRNVFRQGVKRDVHPFAFNQSTDHQKP